jgi:ribosomal protein S18 acetylase RimI-like enzyme
MVTLTFRPAGPVDVPVLLELYDVHYRGGYSACFDRYGRATPQDFWWVQSEKSVSIVELNRKPAGLLIAGRSGKRLLAEEILLVRPQGRTDEEAILRQLHDHLTERFQKEHQERLSLRADESNAVVLALAQRFGFTFSNALVVASGGLSTASPPDGYAVRRARPDEARHIARLHEETLHARARTKDLEAMWKSGDARVFIAERDRYAVGFIMAQVRDGVGRWTVGVRDAHRGRGLGSALVHQALQFFASRNVSPITTYWAVDAAAARFARALGARTERTYLYLDRPL